MARLPRKHIPLEVRLRVVLRQLGFARNQIDDIICDAKDPTRPPAHRGCGRRLAFPLTILAERLDCRVEDLALDHNPALENREKLILLPSGRKIRQVVVPKGGQVLRYFPDELDPDHLLYREKHAHHIKTNVAGDGAQYSDRVLAKRERKRVKKQKRASALKRQRGRRTVGGSTGFPKKAARVKRIPALARPLRSASRFPPKGSRPFNRRTP